MKVSRAVVLLVLTGLSVALGHAVGVEYGFNSHAVFWKSPSLEASQVDILPASIAVILVSRVSRYER